MNHVKPREDLKTEIKHRKFQILWLQKFKWLAYSFVVKGAFCIPCALFSSFKHIRGQFVVAPCTSWRKFLEKAQEHSKAKYHLEAMLEAEDYIKRRTTPNSTISSQTSERIRQNVERNRKILTSVIQALEYCGKQCIALRGDEESRASEKTGNRGNFLCLLKLMAKNDQVLATHLAKPAMRNATMLSPQIQNELLNVIGQDFIVGKLVRDVKQARFFSIRADKVTLAKTEVLAVCLRFVDDKCLIREEFFTFMKVEHITGEVLADAIKTALESRGLQLADVRGQGYDGASNMSCA